MNTQLAKFVKDIIYIHDQLIVEDRKIKSAIVDKNDPYRLPDLISTQEKASGYVLSFLGFMKRDTFNSYDDDAAIEINATTALKKASALTQFPLSITLFKDADEFTVTIEDRRVGDAIFSKSDTPPEMYFNLNKQLKCRAFVLTVNMDLFFQRGDKCVTGLHIEEIFNYEKSPRFGGFTPTLSVDMVFDEGKNRWVRNQQFENEEIGGNAFNDNNTSINVQFTLPLIEKLKNEAYGYNRMVASMHAMDESLMQLYLINDNHTTRNGEVLQTIGSIVDDGDTDLFYVDGDTVYLISEDPSTDSMKKLDITKMETVQDLSKHMSNYGPTSKRKLTIADFGSMSGLIDGTLRQQAVVLPSMQLFSKLGIECPDMYDDSTDDE